MRRPLALGLALVIGAYVVWGALLTWAHPHLIYPFFQNRTDLPGFAPVTLSTPDGVGIVLQVSEGQGPTILYFMGNAGALQFFEPGLSMHQAAGRRVVALEYRGGAGRPGIPDEATLKADALAAADHALAYGNPVVVHGYSLGTGLAVHVAARRDVAGVVLEAPYSRLCALMARAALLPACLMPFVQKWDTLADAPGVRAPVLILHGDRDTLVPPAESVALAAALSLPDRLVLAGADHLDIGLGARARAEISAFIAATVR
jgi:pimeloyl-ACP methyl ester carboxylesterase